MGLSHSYTCIHSPLSYPLIQAAIEHRAEFHVLYSRSMLVTCFKYSSLYMSIPNSLTIPSTKLPPLATVSLNENLLLKLCAYSYVGATEKLSPSQWETADVNNLHVICTSEKWLNVRVCTADRL